MPTAICNSRLRSGSAHWDLDCEEEAAGEEAEEAEEEKSPVEILQPSPGRWGINKIENISKYYISNHFPIIDYSMEVSINGGTLKYLVYNGESIYKWMI